MRVCTKAFVLLAAVLLLTGAVQATENNWLISIKPDDGSGQLAGPAVVLGVSASGSSSPLDFPVSLDSVIVAAVEPPELFDRMILPSSAPYPRIWDLTFAALTDASCNVIRLRFYTVNSPTLPPETVLGGHEAAYKLEMVDNRGVMEAPANGTVWPMPIPTAHSSSPYWVVTLPCLRLSANTEAALLAEGYKLEFRQEVVPEPAGLAALGLGLSGLLAFRRRKT